MTPADEKIFWEVIRQHLESEEFPEQSKYSPERMLKDLQAYRFPHDSKKETLRPFLPKGNDGRVLAVGIKYLFTENTTTRYFLTKAGWELAEEERDQYFI